MDLLSDARWIGLSWAEPAAARPSPILRRQFVNHEPVTGVVFEVTALGLVDSTLDGAPLPTGRLVPGWSDYRSTVRVRRVALADLPAGEHELVLTLGEGWWSGHVGYHRVRQLYGDQPWCRAALRGAVASVPWSIATDEQWQGRFGAITSNDLHDGQHTDLTLAQADHWDPVVVGQPEHGALVIDRAPPIEVVQDVPAVQVTQPLPGVQIVDVGRNLAGHVRLELTTASPCEVALRHGEFLEEDGTLYRANLRNAKQTDRWRLPVGAHVLEPTFTTHGFRYVEVTGAPELQPSQVQARVVRTAMPRVGWFECSDARVNRLHQLLTWSIESNSIAVPTDCPQRDERLGWLEDVAALVPTRAFLFDHHAWLAQWLDDVRAGQADDGWLPDVAPLAGSEKNPLDQGAPGWADAGVQVPWMLYEWYGDDAVLRDNFEMATRFVRAVAAANPDGRWVHRRGADYGDWLGFLPAPKDVVAQAHAARSARCLVEMSRVLGEGEVESWAAQWDALVRQRFVEDHLDQNGHVSDRSQSAVTLALAFGLIPEEARRHVATDDLVFAVGEHGNAVTCGYLALPHILHVLTANGHSDAAWALLMGDKMPGWMHLVDNGATSLWERWDGWDHDTGLNQAWLNSLNHASLGVVGDWLHASVGGLAPAAPGWSRVRIAPRPGASVTSASARHQTQFGEVATQWELRRGQVTVASTIPAGMTAEVVTPSGEVVVHEGPATPVVRWSQPPAR